LNAAERILEKQQQNYYYYYLSKENSWSSKKDIFCRCDS